MIIKSLSRKSGTSQLLNYLFKKEDKLRGEKQKPILIKCNILGGRIEKWVKEFEQNEVYRQQKRKDNVRAYHTIISFSTKDKEHIDEQLLKDIARHYIGLRGKDNLYIGTAHYDHDHIHLHLVMSGTKYLTGESNRISRKEFHQLKLAMDAYQREKYPQLVHSLPEHGKSKTVSGHPPVTRESQKQSLLQSLEAAYSSSKTLDDFLSVLRSQGHEPYYRAGRLTGIKYDGDRKFRFKTLGYTNDKLEKFAVAQEKEDRDLSELRDIRSQASDRDHDDHEFSQGRSLNDEEDEANEKEEEQPENETNDSEDDEP